MPEIRVDTTEVGRAVLRERVLESVRASGYTVRTRPFWRAFRGARAEGLPRGMLVVCDLANVASEFQRSSVHRWVSAVRRTKPFFLVLVRTERDRRVVDLLDDLVRYSDLRVRVCRAEPGQTEFLDCLVEALSAAAEEALVDARFLPTHDALRVEFGDGMSGTLSWHQLGIAELVERLDRESVTVGSGGKTLEFLESTGDVFEIDSTAVRAVLDPVVASSLKSKATQSNAPVGQQLRASRKKAGLTQSALSKVTGIDQAVISRLERGRHRPRLDTLQRMAEAMRLTVSELLGSA